MSRFKHKHKTWCYKALAKARSG